MANLLDGGSTEFLLLLTLVGGKCDDGLKLPELLLIFEPEELQVILVTVEQFWSKLL